MKKNIIWLIAVLFVVSGLLQGEFQPEEYSKSNTGQFKNAIKELHRLNLLGTETILDVGSGDGRISTYIAQECIPNGQLVGLDSNSQMITFASEHAKVTNVSYVLADIIEYVAPDQYDAIVSFWTLHWIEAYEKAMENIARSLKSGGKALLCHIVGQDPLQLIMQRLLNTQEWEIYKKDYVSVVNVPSLSQVATAIEKAGLTIENLEIKKNGEWMPLEVLKQNLLSLPLFDFLPSHLRLEFCGEALQELIVDYPLNEKNEIFDCLPVVVMVLKK